VLTAVVLTCPVVETPEAPVEVPLTPPVENEVDIEVDRVLLPVLLPVEAPVEAPVTPPLTGKRGAGATGPMGTPPPVDVSTGGAGTPAGALPAACEFID